MKIDNNTTVEEVKQKTKDSLQGLCNIKNNESDNGNTFKELSEKEGLNEKLKIRDQMLWISKINNVKNIAE